jgi:hypothetical protein
MINIYENAALPVAAVTASSGNGGILHPRNEESYFIVVCCRFRCRRRFLLIFSWISKPKGCLMPLVPERLVTNTTTYQPGLDLVRTPHPCKICRRNAQYMIQLALLFKKKKGSQPSTIKKNNQLHNIRK